MAGNNRQRKSSSSSFFSAFNIFKSKNRGGGYYDAYDDDIVLLLPSKQESKRVMAGNNRQRKSSSSSFFSAFNIFKSKNRGGSHYDAYDDGTRARKVWRSDEDNGHHGVAEPGIDMRAEMFIRQYKRRVSESELFQIDPATIETQ
ncbi:uncharacterized protein G2W53_001671 [Senna tora]|uniref:Uncharacterized protein n=1 Tax=Senna tora TaxID=362788 RepID=A0A835CIR9_9FABA|nr:uncharacterized protein G2W53_001671 [Senna tora]